MSAIAMRLTRPGIIQSKVSPLEWLELQLLCQTENITQSEAIRLAVREAASRRGLRQVAISEMSDGIKMTPSADRKRSNPRRKEGNGSDERTIEVD